MVDLSNNPPAGSAPSDMRGGRLVRGPAQVFLAMGLLLSLVSGAVLAARAAQDRGGTMPTHPENTRVATFAGGCFWCIEDAFDKVPGVIEATSGYTGGSQPAPSYEQVASGRTDHLESVQLRYDPARVSYRELLEVFWRQIDPTDDGGQFADRGAHYTTAIFVHDAEQRRLAEASLDALRRSGRFDKPIATRIVDATAFYPAEAHHQDYSQENPLRYQAYKRGSGRASFVEQTWAGDSQPILDPALDSAAPAATDAPRDVDCSGQQVPSAKEIPMKPQASELRQRLSPLQFRVTQEEGTEPPFDNAYWNEHRAGIYVDVVSGEPLFSSTDKFDSGTGWPSFTRPIDKSGVRERADRSLWMTRTEVRSARGDSHLGHLFDDGPAPTGQRYCINSAALRFVPVEDMEREGYGEYLRLFETPGR